ncbi:MAG TPA: nuclease-related domain-containing protein [Nitrococcus sp.]|nr:nuclease-related domain-containing protein [Nitrococcus sp.]
MAALIPSLNSCLRRMTPGEKRFAQRLESQLEDDYLCCYDVPIDGRGQHPDFIVLQPSRGLLILEVLHRRARSGGIITDAFKQAGIPHDWLAQAATAATSIPAPTR